MSRISRHPRFTIPYLQKTLLQLRDHSPHLSRITFTLVRHAETRHNERGLLAGSLFDPGAKITELGRRGLLDVDLPQGSYIFHSRLTRARETAVVLATNCNGRLTQTQHGDEMMFGGFEGRPIKDLVENDRAFSRLYFDGDAMASYPGSECLADVVVRAGELIDEIAAALGELDQTELHVVFVGHAIINQALRILAGDLYDARRGQYVVDGVHPRYSHMQNARAMRLVDLRAEPPWMTVFDGASLS